MNFLGREAADAVMNGGFDGDGALGGVTIGVSRQSGQLVLGIEADFSAFGLDAKRDTGVVASVFQVRAVDSVSADWLATLRLRLGYAVGQSLIYTTAGPAFSNISASRFIDWAADGCGGGEFSLNRCHAGGGDITAGWTIGGGVEHAISERWAVKAEYLYADFGEAKFTTVSTVAADQNIKHSIDLSTHIARLGVNYKF
jgi:outer membrane immunogenic protein